PLARAAANIRTCLLVARWHFLTRQRARAASDPPREARARSLSESAPCNLPGCAAPRTDDGGRELRPAAIPSRAPPAFALRSTQHPRQTRLDRTRESSRQRGHAKQSLDCLQSAQSHWSWQPTFASSAAEGSRAARSD